MTDKLKEQTETVRRLANVPRDKALLGLTAKYPDYDVISIVDEKVRRTSAGTTKDETYYVATLRKRALKEGFEDVPMPEGPPTADEAGPEDALDEELADEAPEESDSDKLTQILDLLNELVGEGAEPGAEFEEVPGELPPAPGADDLPAPIKPPNEMGRGHGAFARKNSYVVEAHAPGQSFRDAVNEINAQVMPHGYRVAKISRKGPKLTAVVNKQV